MHNRYIHSLRASCLAVLCQCTVGKVAKYATITADQNRACCFNPCACDCVSHFLYGLASQYMCCFRLIAVLLLLFI